MLAVNKIHIYHTTNMVGAPILLVAGVKMRIFPSLPSKNKAPADVPMMVAIKSNLF